MMVLINVVVDAGSGNEIYDLRLIMHGQLSLKIN
jgi:hypothetical protein